MAKTTAPLLAFGASGQIGKTQVYGSWRGVKYARRYVIPANPKTAAQKSTRAIFLWLVHSWKTMNASVQAVWLQAAKGMPVTDRNLWIKDNMPQLRNKTGSPETDLALMQISPGVNAGIAAGGIATADSGTHHVTITMTQGDLPATWTYVKAHAIAWKTQNSSTANFTDSYYASADAPSLAPEIALPAAMTADCFGFLEFTKPDGSTAFSPSLYKQQVVA